MVYFDHSQDLKLLAVKPNCSWVGNLKMQIVQFYSFYSFKLKQQMRRLGPWDIVFDCGKEMFPQRLLQQNRIAAFYQISTHFIVTVHPAWFLWLNPGENVQNAWLKICFPSKNTTWLVSCRIQWRLFNVCMLKTENQCFHINFLGLTSKLIDSMPGRLQALKHIRCYSMKYNSALQLRLALKTFWVFMKCINQEDETTKVPEQPCWDFCGYQQITLMWKPNSEFP